MLLQVDKSWTKCFLVCKRRWGTDRGRVIFTFNLIFWMIHWTSMYSGTSLPAPTHLCSSAASARGAVSKSPLQV
ncbi:hypothetical protein VTI28DRAFT_7513 [Corynascus sepedonium]